jgi:hypothetical protein
MGVTASLLASLQLGIGAAKTGNMAKVAKKTRHNASKSSKDGPRKRLCGKADASDLPVVKFKVEELGNRACCCKIGR